MSSGRKEKNNTGVRICGVGGMGVILASVVLGKAAIYDNKNAVQTQSYGAEQRGTKVKSDVIISENEAINYPIIDKADILISFSQEAFNFYFPHTNPESLIFINSDNINLKKKESNIYEIPARELSKELKNEKVLNLIMLGALIKISNIISIESMTKAISDTVSKAFLAINLEAFQKGYEYFQE